MNITDLNGQEKVSLIGLLAYMIDADQIIARQEAIELLRLEDEMETKNLVESVGVHRELWGSRQKLLDYAAKNVRRENARELLHTILHDMAISDGNRVRNERELLDDLTLAFARAG